MRRIITAIVLALTLAGSASGKQPMSLRIVRSEMSRCPDGAHLDGMDGKLKWNYTTGLELKAFLDVYKAYPKGNEDILEYVDAWYDQMIAQDGSILKNYKKSNYSTDHICPGNTLFDLYELTGKEKYRLAMDKLREQISEQPKTSEGGFWHKKIYPYQMWLDGLYMAQPFYAGYTSTYTAENERTAAYNEIANNFLTVYRHTYDPQTKLLRHAWDESLQMFWCDKTTGQSAHAWGRALGWYCMALVDVLPYLPDDTEGKIDMEVCLKNIYSHLPAYADPETGMWYQVLDQPGREENYVEATASAMFVYAQLKGIREGYLSGKQLKIAKKNWKKLLRTFVTEEDGLISLNRCCEVAGLGGKENRAGDYSYYVHEKIRSNDPKGIGPLIWAALEIEKL